MTVLERREREFKQREEGILAAALSLFNRDDWQTVTIDQIAAKAEIGKGTIYKHFVTKDDIYARLVIEFHRLVIAELRKVDRDQPPLKAIGEFLDVFWRTHARGSDYKRLTQYCRRGDFHQLIGGELAQELDALDVEFMNLLVPVFERGIREGVLVKKPVPSLMLGTQAAMFGLLEMEGSECVETGLTREQQYQEVREFALRGISKR